MTNEGIFPEPKKYTPSPDEVNQAYAEVIASSESNSGFGGLMGAIISATVESGDVVTFEVDDENSIGDDFQKEDSEQPPLFSKVLKDKLAQNKTEAEMNTELGDILYSDMFARVGIKLVPAGSYIADTDGNRVTSTSLEPQVESPVLFNEYLESIDPQKASESKLLVDVANGLKKRIDLSMSNGAGQNGTPFDRPDMIQDFGMDALRAWTELEAQYERLNLDSPSITLLSQYPHYWAQNVLPEFIEAASRGYVHIDGVKIGFGPAEWALDATPEFLDDNWGKAIDCMTLVGVKNPESELYIQMYDHLSNALQISVQSMKDRLGNADGYSKDYLLGNLKALQSIQERFSKQQ